MASPSYTYALTNSTTADASQVQQNFNDILNGVTDGSKDLSINALTCAGTATFNGNVNIGNSSADDLSVTASLASSIPIKTNNTYDVGSATLGLRKLYLGNGGAGATCDVVAASHATTREYTIPDCSAAASFVMTQGAQTISGVKTFDGQLIGKGTATNDTAASGYIGEYKEANAAAASVSLSSGTNADVTTMSVGPGCFDLVATVVYTPAASTSITRLEAFIGTAAGDNTTGRDATRNSHAWAQAAGVPGSNNITLHTPPYRVNVSTLTTYFCKSVNVFSVSTMSAGGNFLSTRVR